MSKMSLNLFVVGIANGRSTFNEAAMFRSFAWLFYLEWYPTFEYRPAWSVSLLLLHGPTTNMMSHHRKYFAYWSCYVSCNSFQIQIQIQNSKIFILIWWVAFHRKWQIRHPQTVVGNSSLSASFQLQLFSCLLNELTTYTIEAHARIVCQMWTWWTNNSLYSIKIQSQMWYHCIQYTRRHHMSLFSHC